MVAKKKAKKIAGPEKFDLIIAYLEGNAESASGKSRAPFFGKRKGYNASYGYFLKKCRRAGVKACFSTSKDIVGPGLFKSYWTYHSGWHKHRGCAYSEFIFDKFASENPILQKRKRLLTSPKKICVFNEEAEKMFNDKLKSHDIFKEYSIPSVKIKKLTRKSIYEAKKRLDKILCNHKNEKDFDWGYIIKRRCGAGGLGIFKVNLKKGSLQEIKKQYAQDLKEKIKVNYILQPFIECKKGFVFGKHKGLIDLRVVLIGRKIVQICIRLARKGEFKCNVHQGGNIVYKDKKILPKDALQATKKISKKISVLDADAVYALDFLRSNEGNLYFMEGNDKPGLNWDPKNKLDEKKSKELMKLIVARLKIVI